MCGFELPGSGDCASVFSVFWERHCPKMQNLNVSGAGKEVVGKARWWGGRMNSKIGGVPKSRLSSRAPPLETIGIRATSSCNLLVLQDLLGPDHTYANPSDNGVQLYSPTL